MFKIECDNDMKISVESKNEKVSEFPLRLAIAVIALMKEFSDSELEFSFYKQGLLYYLNDISYSSAKSDEEWDEEDE